VRLPTVTTQATKSSSTDGNGASNIATSILNTIYQRLDAMRKDKGSNRDSTDSEEGETDCDSDLLTFLTSAVDPKKKRRRRY
jgi:hypothetical protein